MSIVDAARALIADYEQEEVMNCPFCQAEKPDGHAKGCVLEALIQAGADVRAVSKNDPF